MLDIASEALMPFFTACCRCALNRNYWSKLTPKYFAYMEGCIVIPLRDIAAVVDCRVLRGKYTRTYLDLSNCAPCLLLHSSAPCNNFFNLRTFFSLHSIYYII